MAQPPRGGAPPRAAGSAHPVDPSRRRWALGPVETAVRGRLETWAGNGTARALWTKQAALWPQAPASEVASHLGWLGAPDESLTRLGEWTAFGEEVANGGFDHVVLLGMGGSSLAAEVLARALPHPQRRPDLAVLDSPHPEAIRACVGRAPIDRTIYLVSSKSGTTLEPNALFRFFWERAAKLSGSPGRRFVAITDPGTPLERLAAERHFRASFAAPRDVGGRYSALTVFGLLPAALLGIDLSSLVGSARAMVARCAEPEDGEGNPGLRLGAALGELARAGRDKVVFLPSRTVRAFPAWLEQLLAESLGKLGRGIVPVANPPPLADLPVGADVVLVHLALEGETDRSTDRALEAREAAGTPVLRFELASAYELGGEFVRWELATVTCAMVLGVDPFDQPDVERAKELARAAMGRPGVALTPSGAYGARLDANAPLALERWASSVRPGDYAGVQAFLAPSGATDAALERLVSALRTRLGTVVTRGYGPRFLHSTGQLHKGGPATGLFLQIVDETAEDLPVPDMGTTFAQIVRAQAVGDRKALEEKGRRLLVVNVGPKPLEGLAALTRLLGREV